MREQRSTASEASRDLRFEAVLLAERNRMQVSYERTHCCTRLLRGSMHASMLAAGAFVSAALTSSSVGVHTTSRPFKDRRGRRSYADDVDRSDELSREYEVANAQAL